MPAPVDLLCIGGGIAGLTAAVRAAEQGLRVLVLEQGEGPHYPCNSRISGGIFHLSYSDVTRPADELNAAMTNATHGQSDPALVAAMADTAERAIRWLQGMGAKFIRQGGWRLVLMPPRPLAAGGVWRGRGVDRLLETMTKVLTDLGGELRDRAHVRALRMEGQSCTGVVARIEDADVELAAANVVIADGGFQADAPLFRRALGPSPEKVVQRGAATGSGDGLRMAREAGAALTDLSGFYGHLLSADALTNDRLNPYPILDELASAAIVVDAWGERMMDEGLGGIVMANRLAALPDPGCAAIVADSAIWDEFGGSGPYPVGYIEEVGGTVHRSPSIAGLASEAGIMADRLRATIDGYNEAATSGKLATLTPPRLRAAHGVWREPAPLRPIVRPPFYAVPIRPGITHTMGGIKVDAWGRVCREGGGRIAGLFAIGSSIGGLGGAESGYVGGLMKGVVLGLRAAEWIARTAASEGEE